jgi:hypothetical protein
MPYNVYLVQMVDFPDDSTGAGSDGRRESPSQRESIRLGVEERLQELFREVAGSDTVVLHWTSPADASHIHPGPNELVIYFVDSFMQGIIQPQLDYLRLHARTPNLRHFYDQQYTSSLPPGMGQPLPEFGLTFAVWPDHIRAGSGSPWMISEVYVGEIIRRAFPGLFPRSPRIADWMARQRTDVGRLIAEVAFHEALHNKIDANRTDGFSIHTQGGLASGVDGLARTNMMGITRNQMTQRLHQNLVQQYVIGSQRLPDPAPTPPAPSSPPAGAHGGSGLSDALQGIDDLSLPTAD